MGENIGAVARVLLNFGLVSLRLVAPRDRWPNPKAEQVAVGADQVLKAAQVEWKIEDALADATLVLAATARPRGLEKPVWGPREAAAKLRGAIAAGERFPWVRKVAPVPAAVSVYVEQGGQFAFAF